MALTQVNSEGIKDGEVKTADLADQALILLNYRMVMVRVMVSF